MRHFLFAFLVTLSVSASARSFDGCYQLFGNGALYPAICISGTTEEGIGGAGARLAIFEANTNRLVKCLLSDSLVMNTSRLEFIVNGKRELILNGVSKDGKSGTATVGKTDLKFSKLTETQARPLTDSAYRQHCH